MSHISAYFLRLRSDLFFIVSLMHLQSHRCLDGYTVLLFCGSEQAQILGHTTFHEPALLTFLRFHTDICRLRNASGASPWAFAIKLAKAPLNAPYNKSGSSCPCGSHQLAVLDDDALHHWCLHGKYGQHFDCLLFPRMSAGEEAKLIGQNLTYMMSHLRILSEASSGLLTTMSLFIHL